MTHPRDVSRRRFMAGAAGAMLAAPAAGRLLAEEAPAASEPFALRYVLASSMYGRTELETILAEVRKTGADSIDIWPEPHGNQREQIEQMGYDRFGELLAEYDVALGCLSQYRLGPFGLQEEMHFADRFGCPLIVTGARGPKDLRGTELKAAVASFIEQMKPHLATAEETGVTIAIENHGNSLIESPDSMKWLVEMRPSEHLAVAFAPYHLPQEERLLSRLLRTLGDGVRVFYAWQHGKGCHEKLPKEEELLQMPGRGALDFAPLVQALRDMRYQGIVEIFMHPVPRGVPILETTDQVTAEINRARRYLEQFVSGDA